MFLVTKCTKTSINYLESIQFQYKHLHPLKAQLEYGEYVLFCFKGIRKIFSDYQTAINKRNDNEKLSSSDMI